LDQDFSKTYILEKIKSKELKLNEMLTENLRLEELLQEQQFYVNIIGFCVFLEWLFIINLFLIKLKLLLKK